MDRKNNLQNLPMWADRFGRWIISPEDPEHTAFQGLRVALIRDIMMLLPLIYSFRYHRYRYYSAHC